MNTGRRLSLGSLFFIGLLSAACLIFSGSSFSPLGQASVRAASFEQQITQLRAQIFRHMTKGTYAQALSKVKRYVYLVQRKYGNRHPRYADALNLKAKIYSRLNRRIEARRYRARATQILTRYRKEKAARKAQREKRLAALNKRKAEIKARVLRERQALARKQREKARQQAALEKRQEEKRQAALQQQQAALRKQREEEERQAAFRQTERRKQEEAQKSPVRRVTRSATRGSTRSETRSIRGGSKKKSSPRSPGNSAPPPVIAPSHPYAAAEEAAPEAAPEAMAAKNDEQPKNHTIVKVYYATDRQLEDTSKLTGYFGRKLSKSVLLASMFSGQRSEPTTISYGICEVAIPKSHKAGELESTSYWPSNWKEDPDKHVLLMDILPEEKEAYFNKLKKLIQSSQGKNAFIFVHGYNVSFKDAARRTAQISYDLNFKGAPVFYSWPSTGTLQAYTKDEGNIKWAQTNIKAFLRDFVEKTEAENIYLVAHSMGSRALTGAVKELVNEDRKFEKRFREIILAAPDIDAKIFRDVIAPKMVEASENVTLYVSADDKALLASRKFHFSARAGEAGENIIVVKDIETVDATGIQGSNLLGHSYWAEAKSMIKDILSVFGGTRAADRESLRSVTIDRGTYWTFDGTKIAP